MTSKLIWASKTHGLHWRRDGTLFQHAYAFAEMFEGIRSIVAWSHNRLDHSMPKYMHNRFRLYRLYQSLLHSTEKFSPPLKHSESTKHPRSVEPGGFAQAVWSGMCVGHE